MNNVVPIGTSSSPPAEGLAMPSHFKKAGLRAAWDDLIKNTDATLHVKQQLFTFEIAATLLAKMRSGKAMTATESKDLKRHLITLGLANDDDTGKRKPRKGDEYFND